MSSRSSRSSSSSSSTSKATPKPENEHEMKVVVPEQNVTPKPKPEPKVEATPEKKVHIDKIEANVRIVEALDQKAHTEFRYGLILCILRISSLYTLLL